MFHLNIYFLFLCRRIHNLGWRTSLFLRFRALKSLDRRFLRWLVALRVWLIIVFIVFLVVVGVKQRLLNYEFVISILYLAVALLNILCIHHGIIRILHKQIDLLGKIHIAINLYTNIFEPLVLRPHHHWRTRHL